MRSDGEKHISQSLAQALQQAGLTQKIREQRLLDQWLELVGESIGRISRPERIHEGVLQVRVRSATWRTELLFHKQTILDKIAAAGCADLVRDIRFI